MTEHILRLILFTSALHIHLYVVSFILCLHLIVLMLRLWIYEAIYNTYANNFQTEDPLVCFIFMT